MTWYNRGVIYTTILICAGGCSTLIESNQWHCIVKRKFQYLVSRYLAEKLIEIERWSTDRGIPGNCCAAFVDAADLTSVSFLSLLSCARSITFSCFQPLSSQGNARLSAIRSGFREITSLGTFAVICLSALGCSNIMRDHS